MLLGCLLVLLASAGATAVFVLEQVHTLAQDLSATKALKVDSKVLAQTTYGGPETLLLVGDDTRSVFKHYNGYVPNLANEMLLVRIDPSKPWISIMSIPRELWVPITPPNGQTYTNRLNSAYTWGATTLVKTIRQITGLSVNHVIATTFTQFENAINTLGCIYDTIDERYYHNNANGGDQYQNIDLQPGYQCLGGSEAEQFVSYRHTDSSQIRDARDQSFLLAVKQQYGSQLAGNIGKFERIFGKTVRTDAGLRSQTEILNLANLLISAAGLRVRQVRFQAGYSITVPPGDLTATPAEIEQSVHDFLYGGQAAPTQQVAAIGHKVRRRSVLAHLPLTATLASTVAAEKAAAAKLRFTAEFPKVQDLAGSAVAVALQCTQLVQACIRTYLIHTPSGGAYPIYVEVFANGDLGQYYDVQGTTWTGAPLFANPEQTLRVGRRTYDLYYDGTALKMIAWRQYGAVYWVTNTLVNAVSSGELLAIAEQTAPITATRNTTQPVVLQAASVPVPKLRAAGTPVLETVGSVGGLAMILALPLLMVLIVRRHRLVLRLRRDLSQTLAREASLSAAVPAWIPLAAGSAAPGSAGAPIPADAQGRDYRLRRSPRAGVLIASAVVALVAVAAAGGGYLLTEHAGHAHAKHRRAIPSGPPTGVVAVLNASSESGAAAVLAEQLRAERVDAPAGLVGNVTESLAPGLWILYAGSAKVQAEQLAAMLKARAPIVAPINQAAQAAAGPETRVVVVIA
jgi:LCP family protein required for cell wall assembly